MNRTTSYLDGLRSRFFQGNRIGGSRSRLSVLFLTLAFFGLSKDGSAQDIHFSQFRMTPVFLNPSTAGSFTGDFRAHLNYRNQWGTLGDPYQTFAVSGDGKLFQDEWDGSHLGVGGFAYSDQAGEAGFGTTRGKLAVSYNLAITEDQYIAAGIQGGYDQMSVDREELEWGTQYDGTGHDPDLPSQEGGLGTSSSAIDLGAGVNWRLFSEQANMISNEGSWVQAGAAVHHLTRPEHSLYTGGATMRTSMKYIFHADASIGLGGSGFAVLPGVMYARQGPFQEMLYGGNLRYKFSEEAHFTGFEKGAALSLGVHHRWGDAIIASALLEYAGYAIGFSYDSNISSLSEATNGVGGFEISLRFTTPDPFVSSATSGIPRF